MKRTRRSNTRHAMPTTASTSSSSPDSSEDVKPAAVVSKYFTRARRRSFTQSQVVDGTPSSAETASDLSPKKRGRIVQKQPKKEMADKSARDIKSESSSDQVADIEDYAASSSNVFIYRDQKFKLPWIPRHFQRMWDNIEQMRNQEPAPVDTMGCAHCHDEEELDERIKRLQSLVALMLSSQTRDEINFQAMKRLKKRHLSVQWLLNIDESALANLIKPVSFHNQKAKNLKKTAQILRDDYDDDIPDTVESLCRLPGVGPKMAHLTMMCAWNQVTGMVIWIALYL